MTNAFEIISEDDSGLITFRKEPYKFYYVDLCQIKNPIIKLQEHDIYCLSGTALVNDTLLEANHSIHAVLTESNITGDGKILVAGVSEINEKVKSFTHITNHYTVHKPWGHELWINGENKNYSFKQVFLKAGNQTSLQYHNFKEETNVLFDGIAQFIYKNNDTIENDDVTVEHLDFKKLISGNGIHIYPKTLHRIKAITDIILYEVSTPFLDDVIRVMDDSGRTNGRIKEEHI